MKNVRAKQIIGIFFTFLLPVFFIKNLPAEPRQAYVLSLNDDTINPATAEYIISAINQAEKNNCAAVIIRLDTPGGLLNSTRLIVKKILGAKVPVIVYIAPGGSRAGSAGVFITYASHVAAMAPSTNIGAAHPVQMGGGEKRERRSSEWEEILEVVKKSREAAKPLDEKERKEKSKADAEEKGIESDQPRAGEDPLSDKILNDTVAFIKAIAKERGRNIEWAELSVTKSLSVTENEALEKGVVEIIAKDEKDLLTQLNGRKVTVAGEETTLDTSDIVLVDLPMNSRQSFLNILANPNIAYIFFILGFYGLLYEVTHPGLGAPGVLGAIFLILAFFSMQMLPTNYAGLALITLGIALFIAEAFTPGLGLLAFSGIASMILGSIILFDSSVPALRVSLTVILPLCLGSAAMTMFLVRLVIRTRRRRILGGQEGLISEKGEVAIDIQPGTEGKVFVHGEIWNAVADEEIKKGEKVEVVKVNGMTLTVKRKE